MTEVLDFFRLAIEIDAWGIHFSCYGVDGLYNQIALLMVAPIVAIAFTPLAGLVAALAMKQTTIRKLIDTGLRRGEHGLIDGVLLQYAMPLTLLILFFSFPPITTLAFRAFEKCDTFADEADRRRQPLPLICSLSHSSW